MYAPAGVPWVDQVMRSVSVNFFRSILNFRQLAEDQGLQFGIDIYGLGTANLKEDNITIYNHLVTNPNTTQNAIIFTSGMYHSQLLKLTSSICHWWNDHSRDNRLPVVLQRHNPTTTVLIYVGFGCICCDANHRHQTVAIEDRQQCHHPVGTQDIPSRILQILWYRRNGSFWWCHVLYSSHDCILHYFGRDRW